MSRGRERPPTRRQLTLLADLALELGVRPPSVSSSADAAQAIDGLIRKKRGGRRDRSTAASKKQLRYLDALAGRAGVPAPRVLTRDEAAAAIDALVSKDPPTRRQLKQIAERARDLDVRVPPPTTRSDAIRDLEMLESWRRSRDELWVDEAGSGDRR